MDNPLLVLQTEGALNPNTDTCMSFLQKGLVMGYPLSVSTTQIRSGTVTKISSSRQQITFSFLNHILKFFPIKSSPLFR